MLGPAGVVGLLITTAGTIYAAKLRADKSEADRTPPIETGPAPMLTAEPPRLTVDEWDKLRDQVAAQVRREVMAELAPQLQAAVQAATDLIEAQERLTQSLNYNLILRDHIYLQKPPPPPVWPDGLQPDF